jgi:hypothetical protein
MDISFKQEHSCDKSVLYISLLSTLTVNDKTDMVSMVSFDQPTGTQLEGLQT